MPVACATVSPSRLTPDALAAEASCYDYTRIEGESVIRRSGLAAVLALCAVATLVDAAASADENVVMVPRLDVSVLADDWRRASGDILKIDREGTFQFIDSEGRVVVTGRVLVRSAEPETNLGLQLVHVVTLAFTICDRTHIVPAAFVAGEGDPAHLELYLVPSRLTGHLDRSWGLEGNRVLRFSGTPP